MADERDALFQPESFGLINIPIPVPPMLEQALGYPGEERYVAFHECRVHVPGVFIEDAHGQWPGIAAGWSLFCKHPAVSQILETLRMDLRRGVPVIPWKEWVTMNRPERQAHWSRTRILVLDRCKRTFYVGIQPNVLTFLTIQSTSPLQGPEDDEETPDDFATSPNLTYREQASILCEEPELTSDSPATIDREVLEHLRFWLDQHEPVEREYRPGPTESCGFTRTNIAIERGQLEDAFGYRGGRRYFSIHSSPRSNNVFVCDGIGRCTLSGAIDTWDEFLAHPLIQPHLQTRDNTGRAVPIDFTGKVERETRCPSFLTAEQAGEMEAEVNTHCLLYDRAGGRVYTGTWSAALLFHSLVDEVLEEDLVTTSRATPASLLAWLNRRQDDPEHLFAVAASHERQGHRQETLTTLYRCVEQEPTSHLYWCRLSQALGSLSRWVDALEAADKAVAFHASALRQDMTADYLLKWKARCLFMTQRYSEAADLYRLIAKIEHSPFHAECYAQIARCHERMADYTEAVTARELQVRECVDSLSEALDDRSLGEVDEDFVDDERLFLGQAWHELGRAYVRVGNIEPAEWAFRQALRVFPELVQAHAELGALERSLGRVREADAHLQEALALAIRNVAQTQESGSALCAMAFVYRAMGRVAEAIATEARAADLGRTCNEEERTVVSLDLRGGVIRSQHAMIRREEP
jgi:tetratricopeptide (TPR) repeat protein